MGSLSSIDRLKIGVENSIDTLGAVEIKGIQKDRHKNSPIEVVDIRNLRGSIGAYDEGVSAIRNMIEYVYEDSLSQGVDSNKWLVSKISLLVDLTKTSEDNLLEVLTAKLPSKDIAVSKEFFSIKNEILKDFDRVSRIRKELEEVLASKTDGKVSMEEKSVYDESWCEKYADNSKGKAGYNAEIDAVIIDPKGTIGEIIDCYGLRIALPKPPKTKDEFLNGHIKTRKSQKWRRSKRPDFLTRKTEQKHKDYIKGQFDNKRNGVWIMNNGEHEYITGAHWFLMQWCKTNAKHGGYFHFRQAHKDLFYFMEACYVDQRCLGMDLVKTRRTGATFATLGFELCKSITKKNVAYGMTSKTNADAKKNFGYLTTMFRYLPFWFKPLAIADDSKTKIEYRQPATKTSSKNKNSEATYVALETELGYLPTSEDSYDGFALDIYIADEFSKWTGGRNIDAHWEKVSLAMTEGGNLDGIALVLSTVEYVTGMEITSEDAKSGDKFKRLFENSNMAIRNKMGQTSSGLYALFIPCFENFGGFIDEYGYPVRRLSEGERVMGVDGNWITMGILDYLDEKEKGVKNAAKLNDFWRKNPRDLADAFRVASEDCIFQDIGKIISQINDNNKFENKIDDISEIYTKGDFKWVDGIQDSTVKFVENPNGKFKVSWIPEPEDQNRFTMLRGMRSPLKVDMGVFGVDPYRANKVQKGGSKCGIHGMLSPEDGGAFFLEYIDREKTVELMVDEIIKICVFYGMKALIENNVDSVPRIMKSRGYRLYSMDRPDKPKHKLTGNDKDIGGIPGTSVNLIDTLTKQIEWYISDFMDIDDSDMRHNMPFNETLTQWMAYNPDNRTKFDAAVSSSLAIFANNRSLSSRITVVKKSVDLTGVFNKYKKNGNKSISKRGSARSGKR